MCIGKYKSINDEVQKQQQQPMVLLETMLITRDVTNNNNNDIFIYIYVRNVMRKRYSIIAIIRLDFFFFRGGWILCSYIISYSHCYH